ncbi:MAG: hypothetical protein KAW66_04050 [Candidatus Lokiarchaeota archaeon]|jgi:hypothetical protein|nr:hypothetical protein [Candidatus Lokiarchaeota archaeon]
MVEAAIFEPKLKEDINIPNIEVENKESISEYFKLLLAGTPLLKFSITDKNGKERYSNLLNVEMR